ncbi:phospholipase D-like domain-containing protein [Natrialba sp. INN-245]|uniref:phospholipase D-like domain-containing protein n=1 Tax=Natrialba sp. INN-245 TaxID=2690967 RepID=UPI001311399A|nr:phospholipase D-like domain-containing protein [Natrialba sp. INN-245]MWV39832.1 phospholipase [Natrialba sp. INN-245]
MASRRIVLCVVLATSVLLIAGSANTFAGTEHGVTAHQSDFEDETVNGLECAPPPLSSAGDEPPTSAEGDRDDREPRIVELYPNPTTHGNAGEYLVLEVQRETRLENWTVTDGHTTATIPNETIDGRVAFSTDPATTAELTDHRVLELEGTVRLAVDGDELELRNGTEAVDAVAYEDAPIAERWYRTDGGSEADRAEGRWHPRDGTCFPVVRAEPTAATTFVLPDSPDVPLETIRSADDRLVLAGYTITSVEVADALVDASARGVDVAVLLEAGPVGGTPAATEPLLESLEEGGVDVRAIGGEGARYRFHHPKYAVADDHVLVTSENWKPSGTGGKASRGWGVRLEDDEIADALVATFRADYEGWDTRSGEQFRSTATFVEDDGSGDDPETAFETNHDAETVPVESVELLVAPDNAADRLEALIADADDEILIKQASIAADASVLEATLDAARRGVDVRILLDSTWYHEDENAALANDLEAIAADEELALQATVVDRTDRFEKIHAKGVIVDREAAVVGSANWNENAFENNREVLLVLHGESAAEYYVAVFDGDWNEDAWRVPTGMSLSAVAVLAVAALVGWRYVRFGDRRVAREE